MRTRRVLLNALPLLLVGAVSATAWVAASGRDHLLGLLARVDVSFVALALASTAGWVFLRFVRWQLLLRRVGVRIPARPSLQCYLGGLPGRALPGGVGEVLRCVLLRRRLGVPLRATLPVIVLEHSYDVAALGLLAGITQFDATATRLGAMCVAGALAVALIAASVAPRFGVAHETIRRLCALPTVAATLLLSVSAYALASGTMSLAATALGASLPFATGAGVYAKSTLVGALVLMPAGVGATGSLAILDLTRLGFPLAVAVLVVSLMRLTTVGAVFTVGAGFLWTELRRRRDLPAGAVDHFNAIADVYRAQWSPHVWDALVERKLGLIARALPPPPHAGLGLDLGCGLGIQSAEMRRRGYRVVGLDASCGLLAAGRARFEQPPVVAGSALELPFPNDSFEFVYAIGVLHHLPDRLAQAQAFHEIARVLKPRGLLLLHESNPRNPLFRFYMGYLFPILKTIDEGTEWWIDPRTCEANPEFHLERVHYFTFLPDFTPRVLMRPAMAMERWMESWPTRHYSAHYLAIMRRRVEIVAPQPVQRSRGVDVRESQVVA